MNSNTDAFDAGTIARVVDELSTAGFLEAVDQTRTKPSDLGTIVAGSALRVRSAIRVASVLRQLRPEQVHRDTILTLAQSTAELDEYRLTVNPKGVQKELQTYLGELTVRVPGPVVQSLQTGVADRKVLAARAKKAIACML